MMAQMQERIKELEFNLTNPMIIGEFQQLGYHWILKIIQQNYTQITIFKEIVQFDA